VRQLVNEGVRPFVLDFEQHPDEWRQRLLGLPQQTVYYEDLREDIAANHHLIKQVVSDLQIGAVVIDSASRAQPEPLKGQGDGAVVRKMFAVMHDFEIPSLVIAHVPKAGIKEGEPPRHAANPIGSVQWTNQARLTYSAIRLDSQGSTLVVECKPQKANDRRRPRLRTWEFRFDGDDVIETVVSKQGMAFNLSREIWRLMDKTEKVMTAAMIAVELMAAFPSQMDKITTRKVQDLLYRRDQRSNHPLFRKVAMGWVSVRGVSLWDTDEDD
jgi:hypothetical protein